MASYNLVALMGNLTKDPELRYIPTGAAVCNFGLAVNRTYTDGNGEKQEDVTFVNIMCWNRLAEVTAEYLHKGSPAFIEGRLKQNSWETKPVLANAGNGSRRSKLEVVARSVQFLGNGRPSQDEEDDADVPF